VPHTLGVTTLSEVRTGARVNLEADQIARHVAKLLSGFARGGLPGRIGGDVASDADSAG
jgi:riboflavin synthase alpha subunit